MKALPALLIVACIAGAPRRGAAARLDPSAATPRLGLDPGPPTHQRQLLQFAPCDDAKELTCAWPELPPGADAPPDQDRRSLCCNKRNFRCGVRDDNGGPRCRVCPPMCIDGCPCTKDADGCFMTCTKPPADPCALLKCTQPTPKCVVQGGLATCQAECSDAQPCAKGSLCKAGACMPDPCAATTCGSATARCVVTAAFTASCEDACSADKPCTGSGKLCRDGSCQTSPCATAACAEPTPKCVVTPEFAARCEAECGAGKPACPTGKLCSKRACKPDPCLAARCAEPTPKCSLTADFKAKCEAECGAGKPACPTGKLCSMAAGRCKANPCLALRCTEPTPKCVVASDFRARCEPECGAGKPACPSGTVCSSGRCKPCVTRGTAASLLGSFFRPLCAPADTLPTKVPTIPSIKGRRLAATAAAGRRGLAQQRQQ